ncbi:MAG: hypothetical protein HY257_00005, partial [Chloroflexi bacterium]|nr:hypothetical protein [Chloroflexota bacterium]
MMKRFFALCIFILSVIALRPELAFADTVPINGCLNASQHDWIVYGGNWTASGHGTCGRANINGAWIGSKPFTVTSGATLTFWATSDTGGCCGSVTPSVYNWDSATRNDLTAAGSLSGAFQSFTRDLSAYVGAHISIFFTGTSGAVSDISITNATNSYFGDPRKIGGAFGAGLSPFVADSYTSWVSTDGHNANGALQFNNQACCYTRVWSYPFTSQGETWSFWAKGGNNVTGNLYLAD